MDFHFCWRRGRNARTLETQFSFGNFQASVHLMRQFALNQIQVHLAERVRSLKQTGFGHKSSENFHELGFHWIINSTNFSSNFFRDFPPGIFH